MNKNWYCYAAGSVAAISSPGIAYVEELPDITGCMVYGIALPTIDYQNRVLQAQANWRDRLRGSFHAMEGSGSSSEAGRVWFETTAFSPEEHKIQVTESGVSEMVAEIRSTLSLNIKELAEILGVQRPTVYAWLRGEQNPQGENRRRLSLLVKVAKIWKELSELPLGKAVRESLDSNGHSIVDSLREKQIDYRLLEDRMRAIAATSPARKKSVLDLATEARMDISGVASQRDLFDVMSGKRMRGE